jgi:hypothetical protein
MSGEQNYYERWKERNPTGFDPQYYVFTIILRQLKEEVWADKDEGDGARARGELRKTEEFEGNLPLR